MCDSTDETHILHGYEGLEAGLEKAHKIFLERAEGAKKQSLVVKEMKDNFVTSQAKFKKAEQQAQNEWKGMLVEHSANLNKITEECKAKMNKFVEDVKQMESYACFCHGGEGKGAPKVSTNENYDEASIKKLKTLKSMSQFTKLRFLGKGGFGEVFLAQMKDDPNGPHFAIKSLDRLEIIKKMSGDTERFEQVRGRELEVSYKVCSYKYCLKMFHDFIEDDFDYLIYEVCPGGDL